MAKYRVSKLVQNDLEDIWDYTLHEWSIEQAEKFIGGLLLCFDELADGSIIGKSMDYVRHGYRKLLYDRHYIFYQIAQDGVIEIIRVLHVRMDIENRL